MPKNDEPKISYGEAATKAFEKLDRMISDTNKWLAEERTKNYSVKKIREAEAQTADMIKRATERYHATMEELRKEYGVPKKLKPDSDISSELNFRLHGWEEENNKKRF